MTKEIENNINNYKNNFHEARANPPAHHDAQRRVDEKLKSNKEKTYE